MLKKILIGFAIFLVLLIVIDAGLGMFRSPVVVANGGSGGYGQGGYYQPHDHFWQDMLMYHMMFGGDRGWYGSGYYGHGFDRTVVIHQAPVVVHTAPTYSKPGASTWGSRSSGSSRVFGSGATSRTYGGSTTPTYSRPQSSSTSTWSSSYRSSPSSSSYSSRSSTSFGGSSSRSYGSSSYSSSSSSRSFGGRR